MSRARVGGSEARGAWAIAVIIAGLLDAGPALADGGNPLVLPLGVAVALAQSARLWATTPRDEHRFGTGFRQSLPRQLWFPDLYDIHFHRHPARFAEPVDDDRLAAIELMGRPWHGWMARAAFDSASPAPLGSSWSVFSLEFEFEF